MVGKRYVLTKVIKGVTGGFMPAVPTRIVILDIDDHTVTISQQLQSDSENAVEGYLSTTATVSM
ncbi:hypothetical protein HDV02_004541 [Globomyces sp. JEL0801]|nr:hypothetical protein HDV02_004541 [Globomyces sp. JEL0801]